MSWSQAGNPLFGGAGDSANVISSGAGDPHPPLLGFAVLASVLPGSIVAGIPQLLKGKQFTVPQTFPQAEGNLVDIAVNGTAWPPGPYTIRLWSPLPGAYPDNAPGAYTAIEGQGARVFPIFGNQVLRFTLPRLPLGVFDVQLSTQSATMWLYGAIVTVPNSESPEVERLRKIFPTFFKV